MTISKCIYTCSICEETYESDCSIEETLAEKEALWGDIPLEQCESVCDDCFRRIAPDKNPVKYKIWVFLNPEYFDDTKNNFFEYRKRLAKNQERA